MIQQSTITARMRDAIIEARKAMKKGDVPVGCVIVDAVSGKVIGRGHNQTHHGHDATGHAEIIAIRKACRRARSSFLNHADIYVTLEPCPMCATAISLSRIRRVYFGAYDVKGGGIDHGPRIYETARNLHIPQTYGGIEESVCADMLRAFFHPKR